MFSLKSKVALVTGASQGIGRDTALALAEAGAKVAVAARNEEKLAVLVKDIVAAGGEAFAVKMDVADAEQVKVGFKQVVEKFGRLDILVNNAAITRDGLALRMKQDDWEAVIRTNLTGAHLCIQQALGTMMRARAGRIINIASVVAQHHCERRCAWFHRIAHDQRSRRKGEGRIESAYSAGPHGFRPRRGRGHRVFSQR